MKTELEVINYLLGIQGSAPVADLVTTLHPHVVIAKNRWAEALTEIQKKAWWFNQEYKYVLNPDAVTKEIAIPLNVMQVDVTSTNGVVKRGSKLYNTVTHSYQFDYPITCNMLLKLEIEYLDEIVIDAMRYWAGILVAELDLEDSIKANTCSQFYATALSDMRKADLKAQQRNALNSPTSRRIVSQARYRGRSVDPSVPGGF